jgi:hypothetical protein
MRMPAIHITPVLNDDGTFDHYVAKFIEMEASTEGHRIEPEYESLRAMLNGGWVEHVSVDPDVEVWCDEEFRLKSLEPSALVLGPNGAVWDFGGPLVITSPRGVDLRAWAARSLRVPPTGYTLEAARFEFVPFDA